MTSTRPEAASLSAAGRDRAAGVLLGLACGDALGAAYEFQGPRVHDEPVEMVGGGAFAWEPGQWTDDTSMAVVIARVASKGIDLRVTEALDAITAGFVDWAAEANDVGNQTRHVLDHVSRAPNAAAATSFAADLFARNGKTGNGSLMRTSPVALAYLDDADARHAAARAVSAITHGGDEASEACILWCDAIAHAVKHGTFDGLRRSVQDLPTDRAAVWTGWLDEAEAVDPHEIPHSNKWVVGALLAAWSAIIRTPIPTEDPAAGTFAAQHFSRALEAAVRAGDDTDTVAAIAGSLLGARWGISAIPLAWQRIVHGWPTMRGRDLVHLGLLTASGGRPDSNGWPTAPVQDYSGYADVDVLSEHPQDPGVLLAGVGRVRSLPKGVDAVVSLCRLGANEVPAPTVAVQNHVEVWLIDSDRLDRNEHLAFVIAEAAAAVAALRDEGHTVLLHCVQAQSRTPIVAAAYAVQHEGVTPTQALTDVRIALPGARPNAAFQTALHSLRTTRDATG